MRPFRTLAIAAPALLFVACLGDDTITNTQRGTPIDCETLATSLDASEPTLTTTASGLKYRDQIVGTGPTVAEGQQVAVHYSGCLTDGTKFDENNDADPAYLIHLGVDPILDGFEEGLVGMKVGGRRQLVIPPNLGYGSNPPAQSGIPANATLVFTVDVVATQ